MTFVNDEFWDRMFGKPGTPRRIRHDAEMAVLEARDKRARLLTNWLKHVPFIGKLAACFWYLVLTEGNPRDGLEFAYLNDGMGATVWHTWLQMRKSDWDEPFAGLWPGGAPHSRREAFALSTAAAIEQAES